MVVLSLGFLEDHIVFDLNITPFLTSCRKLSCGSYLCDPQNRIEDPDYKQPSHESVNPLIEFGMSADGPHIILKNLVCVLLSRSNPNRDWYTKTGSEPSLP